MSVENSIGNGTFKINNGSIGIADIIPDTVETVGPVSTTGYDGEVLLPSGNVLMTSTGEKSLVSYNPTTKVTSTLMNTGTQYEKSAYLLSPWTSRTVPTATWTAIVWAAELGLFVAISSTKSMTSSDGINWTERSSTWEAASWQSMVWAPELNLLVVVGTSTNVLTSPDGITWTERDVGRSLAWTSITWAPQLGLFVTVGNDTFQMTSSDGITWTVRANTTLGLTAISWSPSLRIFVALLTNNNGTAYSSYDGITWTLRGASFCRKGLSSVWSPELGLFAMGGSGSPSFATSSDGNGAVTSYSGNNAQSWAGITWAPELSLFVAVSSSGTSRVMTSSDGITWAARRLGNNDSGASRIAWSPQLGLFVALSSSYSLTATYIKNPKKGVTITGSETWLSRTVPSTSSWQGIAWAPERNLFAAVASGSGTVTDRLMTSVNGTTWVAQTVADALSWNAIAWAPELNLFAAVASGGTTTNSVMTSSNGTDWTRRTVPAAIFWNSIVWAPEIGLFVAVGGPGGTTTPNTTTNSVMISSTGTSWVSSTVPAALTWNGIVWAPELSLFVAVASSGTLTNSVMTSPDGTTWTSRTVPEALSWKAIAWSPELRLFAAIGSDGTNRVMTSPNGSVWTSPQTAPPALSWNAITWAPEIDLFVAVATGNTVMTSSDGTTWTSFTVPASNQWNAIAWAPSLGVFSAVASTGTVTDMVMSITYTNQTSTNTGTTKNTTIQMTDGRTVLIPSVKNKRIAVYNPLYNTILRNGPYIQNNFSYRSAVLLSDNRILLVPFYGTNIRVGIYTPNTTTGTLDITTKINTNGGYLGGVLINNDTVLFVPALYGTTVGIYTISTNALVSHATALTGFNGGVLLNDGRVLLVPNTATKIGLYDPTTDTLSEGASATGYSNGKLLSDGTVILFPNTASQVARYNPVDNTIEFGASATGYNGGVVSQNGTIIMTPTAGKQVAIYHPKRNMAIAKDITVYGKLTVNSMEALPTVNTELSTNTKDDFLKWLQGITTVRKSAWWANATTLQFAEATFAGTSLDGSNTLNTAKYSDGILMPDGRVVFVPYNSNKLGIYNPSANTFTESTFTGTSLDGVSTAKYSGGVLMPDGRVAFIPLNSNKLGIYNPSANTFTESAFNENTIDGANPSTNKYSGGVLTSDGRGVVFVPSIPNLLGIYYPSSNTFAERIFTGTSLNGNRTLIKSPKFLSATVIDTTSIVNFPSTGWVLSASSVGAEGTVLGASDYSSSDIWINNPTATFAVSPEQWIKIQYPSAVVVKSYAITSRNSNGQWFPSQWSLQGSSDNETWIDLEAVRNETTWVQGTEKVYTDNINTNNVAYLYYRLRITNSRQSTSISTNTRVAIAEWKLYSTGATLTDSKYNGSVLMPDGRIVLVPQTSNKLAIFNPTSNTFVESITTGTTLDGTVTSADKYSGGVLIPDGRVVFVPLNSNKLGIYNPTTNIFVENTYANTTLNGSDSTVAKYTGGVLAPDGRVIFVPTNSNKLGIYNPTTDTFTESTYSGTTLDGSVTGSGKYTGGVLLPDGRILFIPRDSNKLGILSGFAPVPKELCLHPCFNKF